MFTKISTFYVSLSFYFYPALDQQQNIKFKRFYSHITYPHTHARMHPKNKQYFVAASSCFINKYPFSLLLFNFFFLVVALTQKRIKANTLTPPLRSDTNTHTLIHLCTHKQILFNSLSHQRRCFLLLFLCYFSIICFSKYIRKKTKNKKPTQRRKTIYFLYYFVVVVLQNRPFVCNKNKTNRKYFFKFQFFIFFLCFTFYFLRNEQHFIIKHST